MEDSFLPYNMAISAYDCFLYFQHIQKFHFLTNGKDITAYLEFRSTIGITTVTLWGHFYTLNKGFLNKNTAITRQLIRTARTLEAEWLQVCREAWVRGQRGDELSSGRVWAAGFHHVRARSGLERVLKIMNRLLF